MTSGIYKITNIINGKMYIGSAVNLEKRKREHFLKTHNKHLFRSMEKYGKENFLWSVIEYCEIQNLLEREQFYIDQEVFENLYNEAPTAGSLLGIKKSEEARQKISFGNKGKKKKPLSENHKKRISEANIGKTIPDHVKEINRERMKGNKINTGKKYSSERVEKVRQANLGKHYKKLSEEEKINLSNSLKEMWKNKKQNKEYEKMLYPEKSFEFLTECTSSDGKSIAEMKEKSEKITRQTFLSHVLGMNEIERKLGYTGHNEKGLHMKNDPFVSYYASTYQGEPCYYFVWSAIEFVFTKHKKGSK